MTGTSGVPTSDLAAMLNCSSWSVESTQIEQQFNGGGDQSQTGGGPGAVGPSKMNANAPEFVFKPSAPEFIPAGVDLVDQGLGGFQFGNNSAGGLKLSLGEATTGGAGCPPQPIGEAGVPPSMSKELSGQHNGQDALGAAPGQPQQSLPHRGDGGENLFVPSPELQEFGNRNIMLGGLFSNMMGGGAGAAGGASMMGGGAAAAANNPLPQNMAGAGNAASGAAASMGGQNMLNMMGGAGGQQGTSTTAGQIAATAGAVAPTADTQRLSRNGSTTSQNGCSANLQTSANQTSASLQQQKLFQQQLAGMMMGSTPGAGGNTSNGQQQGGMNWTGNANGQTPGMNFNLTQHQQNMLNQQQQNQLNMFNQLNGGAGAGNNAGVAGNNVNNLLRNWGGSQGANAAGQQATGGQQGMANQQNNSFMGGAGALQNQMGMFNNNQVKLFSKL